MDVSIIMINYNTFELTKNAIESIFEFTNGLEYELILIDNNSPDGSGEKLCDYFKEKIIYIQSGGNYGTSKSFNIGVKKSLGKYILWLNTDILIKENFIYKLFLYMEKDMKCGICGGNILDFNGKPMHSYREELPSLKSTKKDMSLFNMLIRKFKKRFYDQYNYSKKEKEVGYITGADMMIRRSVFDEIGLFDEEIFMYAEETEFTARMKKNTNYTVMSIPYAKIYHLEGASFNGNKNSLKKFEIVQNGVSIYMKKTYGLDTLLKYYNLKIKGYKKYIKVFKMFNKKSKIDFYKQKIDFMNKKIEKIDVKEI